MLEQNGTLSKKDKEQANLGKKIFGHRLMAAQTWFEYLLEFLNVLVGFDYELSQIQSAQLGNEPGLQFSRGYARLYRVGLRRFVFYGTGGRDNADLIRDGVALELLQNALVQKIQLNDGGSRQSAIEYLESIRELLRSFRVVEYDRSWFAKSLFPAHESFLFYECYRRRDVNTSADELKKAPPSEHDSQFDIPHNFYCRGGELYYLLLAHGTNSDPRRASSITSRLKHLLQSNTTLGAVAATIDRTWNELTGFNADAGTSSPASGAWLPLRNARIGGSFAEELDSLLSNSIDSMELLVLTGYLVAFQIIRYIYYSTTTALGVSPAFFFVDCLGYGRVRELSAKTYKQNDSQVYRAADAVNTHGAAEKSLRDGYMRHQYPIHRNLGKRIGLIAPITGANPRYVISDEILRALVLTVVPPGKEMTFEAFLECLWVKYQIAIGPREVAKLDRPEFDQLNRKLLESNEAALRERLKNNGLLEIYSDAVAIVRNRFSGVNG